MALHHRILKAAYPVIKLTRDTGRLLGVGSPHALRVLLYHDVAPKDKANFAAQLRWLARSWTFVSPELFGAMISGDEPVRGRNLLLTFDDGFASNREIAEEVLNPLGISAIFFVVSEFVDIVERVAARRFISKSIYPGFRPEVLPAHWVNMGWNDLEALLEQGHSVGSHTRTHARLSELSYEYLTQEIVGSGDAIAHRLGISVEHFAYTFGDAASFSPQAMSIALNRYRFIYSGLRGGNADHASASTIYRDASAVQNADHNYEVLPNYLLGAFLEGVTDGYYAESRRLLDTWALSP